MNGPLPAEKAENLILNGRSDRFFGIRIGRGRGIVTVKLLAYLIQQRLVGGGASGDGAFRFLRHKAENFSDRKNSNPNASISEHEMGETPFFLWLQLLQ